MKNILDVLLLAVLSLTLMSGCEEELSNKELLTGGLWSFEDLSTDSEDQSTQQLVALGKALLTDATMELSTDGTYEIQSPLLNDPQTGSWSLVGDDQLIITPDGDVPSTGNIQNLSENRLTYIETMVDQDLGTYTVSTTWLR